MKTVPDRLRLMAAAAAASLLAPFALVPAALAQEAAQAEAPAGLDYAAIDADPAIWAVRDADTTMYVFGTFHLLPDALDWKTETIDAAFDEAGVLVLEVDAVSETAQAEAAALIPQLGFNQPGVTLSSLISDEAEALLAEIAPSVGFAPAALEPFQPWLASLTLSLQQIAALGFDPNAGVEMILASDARAEDMERVYLETVEEQLRFFADQPMDVQVAYFEAGLSQMERTPAMMDDMVEAWATGDMDALYGLLTAEMRDQSPEVYQALIVDRNRNWIPQLEALMEGEGVVFTAVGAGHLPGEYGVIALMEDAGFDVERLDD